MAKLGSPDEFVMPGDMVTSLINERLSSPTERFVIGPGLRRVGEDVQVVKQGILRYRTKPTLFWVDCRQKRYVPIRGERVVGTVVAKGSLNVRVDIGANDNAHLSIFSFENATKKNRPNINVGDVVFARILTACKDIETELVCVTSKAKKDGMGVLAATVPSLQHSFVVTVPIQTVRRLLKPGFALLPTLGKKFRFETAVGMNGRIWVASNSVSSTIFICNAISKAEHLNDDEIVKYCTEILDVFEKVGK